MFMERRGGSNLRDDLTTRCQNKEYVHITVYKHVIVEWLEPEVKHRNNQH